MKKFSWFIVAAGVGGAAVYFGDPKRGPGRRSQFKNQLQKLADTKQEALNVMVSDFTNRSKGVAHDVQEKLESVALTAKEGAIDEDAETLWTPAACLVVATAGLLLTLKGLLHRGMYGGMLSTVGVGLLAKSFADTEAKINPEPQPLALAIANEEEEPQEEGKSHSRKASVQ